MIMIDAGKFPWAIYVMQTRIPETGTTGMQASELEQELKLEASGLALSARVDRGSR